MQVRAQVRVRAAFVTCCGLRLEVGVAEGRRRRVIEVGVTREAERPGRRSAQFKPRGNPEPAAQYRTRRHLTTAVNLFPNSPRKRKSPYRAKIVKQIAAAARAAVNAQI